MKRRSGLLKMAAVSAAILATFMGTAVGAASKANIKTVNGTPYWDVDPGPIDPGTFWTSGQYKYDPNAYMDRNRFDSDQVHNMTVFAEHSGKQPCVFRKRVIVSDWDYRHPYLRVCRPGADTLK